MVTITNISALYQVTLCQTHIFFNFYFFFSIWQKSQKLTNEKNLLNFCSCDWKCTNMYYKKQIALQNNNNNTIFTNDLSRTLELTTIHFLSKKKTKKKHKLFICEAYWKKQKKNTLESWFFNGGGEIIFLPDINEWLGFNYLHVSLKRNLAEIQFSAAPYATQDIRSLIVGGKKNKN